MLPVAILAGGLGTRLRPVTEKIPKCMIEVAGKPFVEHQLSLLRENGFRNIVFCLGYLGSVVQEYVGSGSRFDLQVAYSFDGDRQLGTAGALRKAVSQLGPQFLVIYGDTYLDVPYRSIVEEFHASQKLGLMTVIRNREDLHHPSNVAIKNGIVSCYSKTETHEDLRFIDYGISIFQTVALNFISDGDASDLSCVFSRLINQCELSAFEVARRFYEIGSFGALKETETYLWSRKGGVVC